MMDNLLNAKQAYEISKRNEQSEVERQLNDILHKILNSANSGYYSMLYKYLIPEVRTKLRDLGYVVGTFDPFSPGNYIIHWGDVNDD